MNESTIIKLALVDDHRILIDGLKLLLHGNKNLLIASETTSAKEMLQLLENIEVHVLITDIMMPGMDGYELSIEVKKNLKFFSFF